MHRQPLLPASPTSETAGAAWPWPAPPEALLALAADWVWTMDAQLRLVRMARIDGQPLPSGLERALGVAVDITARKRTEQTLREVRADLTATLRALPDLMFEVDREGTFHHVHAPRPELLLVPPDAIVGRNQRDLLPPGTLREAELSELAFYDALTGLPNRRLLLDRIEQTLLRQAREPSWCALLFIDLDDFKRVNDHHGHGVGDQVLTVVAQRLRASVRETDPLGRLAGDEFVALLPDLGENAAAARRVAQRVARTLVRTLGTPLHDRPAITPSASVGVLMFRGHHAVADLLAQADWLMYRAKDAGKGQLTLRWYGREAPTPAPRPPAPRRHG